MSKKRGGSLPRVMPRRAPAGSPRARVMIASPSYSGEFPAIYVSALLGTMSLLSDHGAEVGWGLANECPLLSLARARIVTAFLASQASHLLMIDADQGWRPPDVLRLLGHGLPMVCGLSPSRREGTPNFMFKPFIDPVSGTALVDRRGLVRLEEVGLAFVLCQRVVFETMVTRFPERLFRVTAEDPPGWDLFPMGRNAQGGFVGEDISFCRLWTGIGGEIWLDPEVQLEHRGSKIYRGDPRTLFAPGEKRTVEAA